jgi:hypothetical protein
MSRDLARLFREVLREPGQQRGQPVVLAAVPAARGPTGQVDR